MLSDSKCLVLFVEESGTVVILEIGTLEHGFVVSYSTHGSILLFPTNQVENIQTARPLKICHTGVEVS